VQRIGGVEVKRGRSSAGHRGRDLLADNPRLPNAENHYLPSALRQQLNHTLDLHLVEAASGQLSPAAALKATAVDFEEITIRLGRERQGEAYRSSLGF